MGAPWHVQLLATVRRNLVIKRRDASQTLQEILLPVYIIFLLVLVKLGQPHRYLPGTSWMNKVDANCKPVEQPFDNVCWAAAHRAPNETLLAYVPQGNKAVGSLMLQVAQEFGDWYSTSAPQLTLKGFDTEKDLVVFYNTQPEVLYAGVIFDGADGMDHLPADLQFRIRINGTYVPSTAKLQGDKDTCHDETKSCLSDNYLSSGFLALQTTISQVATAIAMPSQCGISKQIKSTFVQKQPVMEVNQSFASTIFQLFTAMYMVWAFAPQFQTTLFHIVEEKESMIKDCMMVMGLRESIYWLCWLITYALMSLITVFVVVWAANYTTLFEFSSIGVVFVLLYSYSLSLITMAFSLSIMFTKARTATVVSGLLMIFSSLAVIPVELLQWSSPVCGLLALFSPSGFAMAINVVVRAEGRGRGVHFRDFWSRSAGLDFSDRENPLSLGALVFIILTDAIFYGVTAWYLDNTWPHPERGPKRPWGFCFSSKYWFPSTARNDYTLAKDREVKGYVSQQQLDDASLEMDTMPDTALEVETSDVVEERNNPDIEPANSDLRTRPGVVLKNLRKVKLGKQSWWQSLWGGARGVSSLRVDADSDIEVVKGLNLTLYEGQCFAIVGHSGSGKSAVLNMLSGISRATSGEAYIYGLPVTDAGEELCSLIGVCPQQDTGVSLLTVREQLEYFATIKGQCVHLGKDGLEKSQQPRPSVEQMTEDLIADLQLVDDADKQIEALTHSAKRKVSLAIALIGDPQVVILDQPTNSLDLVSKKQFWDMLHRHQQGRVILFSTDSMDEADTVADRKAVISHGALKCCGSSLFLRNRFGLSYLLHVTKGERFNATAVWELVQTHVPSAVLLPAPRGQGHVTFKLPLGVPAQTSALLMALTERATELGLDEGALEATTLEEVFMQFQDEDEAAAAAGLLSVRDVYDWNTYTNTPDEPEDEALLIGGERSADVDSIKRRRSSLAVQISAITRTRLTLYRRNLGSIFTTFMIPLVLALAVLIAQLFIGKTPPGALPLQDSRFGKTVPIFYTVPDTNVESQVLSFLKAFGDNHVLVYPRDSENYTAADLTDMPNNDETTHIVGISFDKVDFENCTLQYTVACHPLQTHEVPTVAAMVDNLFLNFLESGYTGNQSIPSSLHVSSHPLPYEYNDYGFAYGVVTVIVMSLMLIPPILTAQVVLDKQFGILGLFRTSGMRGVAYWLATLFSDLLLYETTAFLILGSGLAFGHPPFIKEAAPAILVLLLVTIPATVLLGYNLSFFFRNAQLAASLLSLFFLLLALVPYLIIVDPQGNLSYRSWHYLLILIDPPYALISGLHFIVATIDKVTSMNGAAPSEMPTPLYFFHWDNYVILSIACSAAASVIFLICLWQLETHVLDPEKKPSGNGTAVQPNREEGVDGSSDVEKEKARVQSNAARWEGMGLVDGGDGPEGDLILCCSLGKSYGSSEVIRDLWLAVGHGEVVVLVGGHKSGKSTLLHCLAGTEPLSFGDAIMCGESVRYSHLLNRRRIGFCPQYEALYMSMTVREHLQLYTALKGVPEPRSLAVETALQALNLSDAADMRIKHCKAGTRRMLSLALAMLGGPSVLLLDEPSNGMDFASRQKAWKHISAQAAQCAVLICTQSFQEASVLGTRVGIMVDGQLKCLAPPQELKLRYGSNYSLLILADPDRMPEICSFINSLFPSGSQSEDIAPAREEGVGLTGQTTFQVPVTSLVQLTRLLHELEAKREILGIKDYIVSQPTLQQVFHRLSQSNFS